MKSFSFFNRAEIKTRLATQHYDIIVIGGGITGAGIALDAASRGLKVALIEKNDFASGTSSKSTKLIHGGLRYLKQFHVKMVSDVGRERKIVHELAPHLVLPEKMLLPIMKGDSMGRISISIGLKLYDMLAGVKGDDRRKMLNRKKTLETEPLLPEDRLTGGGLYAEYRTDDARLTLEIIKTAYKNGADILNYVEAEDFIYENNLVSGVECFDHLNKESFAIHGKFVVNAGGPWVDDLRELNHSKKGKHLHLTKGVHLVVDREKLPVNQSLYFEIEDGRMIFIIPRDKSTYIGTTDTDFEGNKDNIPVTRADAKYLITAVNDILPSIQLSIEDVKSSWAGLRPLISEEGKTASEISRKDEIFISESGLISMAGGKLTGYRKMADNVVNMIGKKMIDKSVPGCKTKKLPLQGNSFSGPREVSSFIQSVEKKLNELDIPRHYAAYLVHNYGDQTTVILKDIENQRGNDPEVKLILAELHFSVENEMVCTVLDFVERRTGRLYFHIETIQKYRKEILEYFREKFSWSDKKVEEEKNKLNKTIENSQNFN